MASFDETRTHASLLQRLQNPQEQTAWQDFVNRYGPRIYRWCRHWNLQEADAEDVTQNVLLKLAAQMRSFSYDPRRSFRAWLKTITHHAWRDYVDGLKPGQRGGGDSEIGRLLDEQKAADSLNEFLDQEHQRALLEEALARVQGRVEAKTYEAFRLQALEQKSGSAAAQQLGLSVAAAFMARSRVQAMLRDEIHRLENPDP